MAREAVGGTANCLIGRVFSHREPSGSYMIPRVAIRPALTKKGIKAVVASCVFYDDRFEITADVGQELVEFFHNEPLTVVRKLR